MKMRYSDKTDVIRWWRGFLQSALDEGRSLKSVIKALDETIAQRMQKEDGGVR